MLIFERKIFRRIYGAKYENGEWKSWTNRELEEMSKGENIVKWIKGQRISWLGHLERMEVDRISKKIFTQELWDRDEGEDSCLIQFLITGPNYNQHSQLRPQKTLPLFKLYLFETNPHNNDYL